MLTDAFRKMCLLFGAIVVFAGTGMAAVYGILLFYAASPGGATVPEVVGPLNAIVAQYFLRSTVAVFVAVVLVGFAWEVRDNGLLGIDDRLLVERKKDWRRQKAQESEVWSPPEEDREGESVYQRLRKQASPDREYDLDASTGEDETEDADASPFESVDADATAGGESAFETVGDAGDTDDERAVAPSDVSVRTTIDRDGTATVRGKVRNDSLGPLADLRVEVSFLDADGDTIDRGIATRDRLEAKSVWRFEVYCSGDRPVADYEVAGPAGP